MRRLRGPLLAGVLSALALAAQLQLNGEEIRSRTRFDLPGFDAHVYMVMAEQPAFFSVAPWGYRVSVPWLVSQLPVNSVMQGFRRLNLAAFGLAGILLFLWLRSVGRGEVASLVATAALGLLPPVAECLTSVALVDPVALVLVLAFAVSVERRAPLVWLSALAACLALTKEIWPSLVPLVALRRTGPWRKRVLDAALVALPAGLVGLMLRRTWTPHIEVPRAEVDLAALVEWLDVLATDAEVIVAGFLLGGITVVAAAGLATPRGRQLAARYGYLIALAFAAPLLAWVNLPSSTPSPHVGANVPRLVLYAAPWLLGLALCAADLFRKPVEPGAVAAMDSRAWQLVGAAALAMALMFPLTLDAYRREPLHERRDGPFVATFIRESLRTARQLGAGRVVEWDLERLGFQWGVDDPGDARRMRWFLREGWGIRPHYGHGSPRMRREAAVLIVPVFDPAAIQVDLRLRVGTRSRVRLSVNGTPLESRDVAPDLADATWMLPAAQLYRGDNRIGVLREAGGPGGPSLEHVRLSLAGTTGSRSTPGR